MVNHVLQHLRVAVDIAKHLLWLTAHKYLEELAEVDCQHWVQFVFALKEGEQMLEELISVRLSSLSLLKSGSS